MSKECVSELVQISYMHQYLTGTLSSLRKSGSGKEMYSSFPKVSCCLNGRLEAKCCLTVEKALLNQAEFCLSCKPRKNIVAFVLGKPEVLVTEPTAA